MLSKTSRKDVAKDKASDLASAVADAAEAGREKIAPVARNVTGHLSDAADKASEAAAPHVAKAKESVAEAAAPHVAKAKDAGAEVAEAAAPHVERAKQAAKDASADAADAAAPRVKKAKKAAKKASQDAADAAAPRVKKARKARKDAKKASRKAAKEAAPYAQKVKTAAVDRAEAAGLTRDQAHRLFADEWMPRIQETIAATAAAGGSAYAALPQQARDAVETVAPQIAKKHRKKGKVLITLGLLAGAGAVALYVSGQQKGGAKAVTQVTPPEVERLEVSAAEDLKNSNGSKGSVKVSDSDDAVGDLEKDVDGSVSGSRRGRHAAQE